MTSGKRFIADSKRLQRRLGLLLERDLDEHADRGADFQRIEQRHSLEDDTRLLELSNARQARRRRQADSGGEADIR
jgi:hypothetical protein